MSLTGWIGFAIVVLLAAADAEEISGQATSPKTDSESDAGSRSRPETMLDRIAFPALVMAGGPIVGPHAFGSEACRAELQRCEKTGTFFGLGANLETRGRLYRWLYLHTRIALVGNVSPSAHLYTGGVGLGLGLGAYGRWLFGRAEYIFFHPFGDNTFPLPFGDDPIGRGTWTRHACLISAGIRKTFRQRLAIELWAGPMFGQRTERVFPAQALDRTALITFLAGVNVSYTILQHWTRR